MNDALTREKVAELRELCEKATPGPWTVERINAISPWTDALSIASEPGSHVAHTTRGHEPGRPSWGNANFIAAAREWLPVLLDLAASLSAGEGSGMETTAEERAFLARIANEGIFRSYDGKIVLALLRDFDRQSAEIARLLALSAKARED